MGAWSEVALECGRVLVENPLWAPTVNHLSLLVAQLQLQLAPQWILRLRGHLPSIPANGTKGELTGGGFGRKGVDKRKKEGRRQGRKVEEGRRQGGRLRKMRK